MPPFYLRPDFSPRMAEARFRFNTRLYAFALVTGGIGSSVVLHLPGFRGHYDHVAEPRKGNGRR